jgi:N-acetylglucosamine-6-sulfatase
MPRWRPVTRTTAPLLPFLVACAVIASQLLPQATRASAQTAPPPDIVLIVTDDQRWDTLDVMPTVQSELIDKGIHFSNGMVPTSVCCPSRASLLTGNYAHTTGVWSNDPPFGGFPAFDDTSTVATWLHDAGYLTGLFGKYLNHYGDEGTDPHYVPPGWDRWMAFSEGGYYDYTLNVDGELRSYGSAPEDYSTTMLANEVVDLIRAAKASQPLFVYFTPLAPHPPAIPAPQDEDVFNEIPEFRPPAYGEPDVSDKPTWVQAKRRISQKKAGIQDDFRERQLETLQAVDRAIGDIISSLEEAGRLSNTLIVYASDNGYMWGEHRLFGKNFAYDASTRIPFVVRYDDRQVGSGAENDALVLNIDVAPTIAELAGAAAPSMDGRTMTPLIEGSTAPWRTSFLLEHEAAEAPSYCGMRRERDVFVHYSTGEEEYYRYATDPDELQNLAGESRYRRRLNRLRRLARDMCVPTPPGFSW